MLPMREGNVKGKLPPDKSLIRPLESTSLSLFHTRACVCVCVCALPPLPLCHSAAAKHGVPTATMLGISGTMGLVALVVGFVAGRRERRPSHAYQPVEDDE